MAEREYRGAWDYLLRDVMGLRPYNDLPKQEIEGFEFGRDREIYRAATKASIDAHSLEIYKVYREKVVHEDTLTNFRTSWHVAIQAFLFGGLALAYSRLQDSGVIAVATVLAALAGIVAAITTLISVHAADGAINKTTEKWKAPYKDKDGRELRLAVRDIVDPNGLLPAIKGAGSDTGIAARGKYSSQVLPVILALLWMILIAITVSKESGAQWTSSGIVFSEVSP